MSECRSVFGEQYADGLPHVLGSWGGLGLKQAGASRGAKQTVCTSVQTTKAVGRSCKEAQSFGPSQRPLTRGPAQAVLCPGAAFMLWVEVSALKSGGAAHERRPGSCSPPRLLCPCARQVRCE